MSAWCLHQMPGSRLEWPPCSCDSKEDALTDPYCKVAPADVKYTAWVLAPDMYHDNKLRVFVLNMAGKMVNTTACVWSRNPKALDDTRLSLTCAIHSAATWCFQTTTSPNNAHGALLPRRRGLGGPR